VNRFADIERLSTVTGNNAQAISLYAHPLEKLIEERLQADAIKPKSDCCKTKYIRGKAKFGTWLIRITLN
jgi:hypothetical protein